MKKIIFMTAVFALSLTAQADLVGTWTGTGTVNDDQNWKADCDTMSFVVDQTASRFRLVNLNFSCGSFTASDQAELTLEISNGKLFAGSQEVGTIDSQSAHVQVTDSNGNLDSWNFQMGSDGSLSYDELAHISGGAHFLQFHGTFSH